MLVLTKEIAEICDEALNLLNSESVQTTSPYAITEYKGLSFSDFEIFMQGKVNAHDISNYFKILQGYIPPQFSVWLQNETFIYKSKDTELFIKEGGAIAIFDNINKKAFKDSTQYWVLVILGGLTLIATIIIGILQIRISTQPQQPQPITLKKEVHIIARDSLLKKK